MEYLPECVFYICVSLIIYKYIDSYYKYKRDIIYITTFTKCFDSVMLKFHIAKPNEVNLRGVENESIYKMLMEVLLTVGFNPINAKNKITQWIQNNRMSAENAQVEELTEYFGTRAIQKLRERIERYFDDDSSNDSSDADSIESANDFVERQDVGEQQEQQEQQEQLNDLEARPHHD
jgi:hypothetical protein